MYKNRPFPVTLVCLYLLGTSTYHIIYSFAYLGEPDTQASMEQIGAPYVVQVAMLYLDWIVTIVAAMFMMQDAKWARWLYLGWGFLAIDYNLYIQPNWQTNVIPIGVYLVSAFILLMPSANDFFTKEAWE